MALQLLKGFCQEASLPAFDPMMYPRYSEAVSILKVADVGGASFGKVCSRVFPG